MLTKPFNSRDFLIACILVLLILLPLLGRVQVTASPDSVKKITFRTNFGTSIHSETVTVPAQALSYWQSLPHEDAVVEYHNGTVKMDLSQYIDTESVASISQYVASLATLGEEDVADGVLSYVQNVGYVADNYTITNTLYPVETLALSGVCDDLSVLYASMMVSVGFKVIFIWYPRSTDAGTNVTHMNVGVHLTKVPEHITGNQVAYLVVDGLPYYIAETTKPGWRVGDLPKTLAVQSAYVEKAPAPERSLVITMSTGLQGASTITLANTEGLVQTTIGMPTVTTTTLIEAVSEQNNLSPLTLTLMAICGILFLAGYLIGKRR
jgi:hypothetical protein